MVSEVLQIGCKVGAVYQLRADMLLYSQQPRLLQTLVHLLRLVVQALKLVSASKLHCHDLKA